MYFFFIFFILKVCFVSVKKKKEKKICAYPHTKKVHVYVLLLVCGYVHIFHGKGCWAAKENGEEWPSGLKC